MNKVLYVVIADLLLFALLMAYVGITNFGKYAIGFLPAIFITGAALALVYDGQSKWKAAYGGSAKPFKLIPVVLVIIGYLVASKWLNPYLMGALAGISAQVLLVIYCKEFMHVVDGYVTSFGMMLQAWRERKRSG